MLTPEVQALVGVRSEPVAVEITPRLVRRTIETYGGDASIPCAPGDWAPAAVLVGIEGEAPECPFPPVLPENAQVSHEIAAERPLRVGERLFVTAGVSHVTERFGGRFQHHLQVRRDIECTDEAGTLVARASWTDAFYRHHGHEHGGIGEGAGDDWGYAPDWPPAAAPTFATLHEGDRLPGPRLRPEIGDGVRCCALTWLFSPYFYDPAHRPGHEVHGSLHVVMPGPLRLLYLFRAAHEWVGEAGFVRSVRIAYRRPLVAGTEIEVQARIGRVYEEAGARRADIEQVIINAAGQEHDRGFAVVEFEQ